MHRWLNGWIIRTQLLGALATLALAAPSLGRTAPALTPEIQAVEVPTASPEKAPANAQSSDPMNYEAQVYGWSNGGRITNLAISGGNVSGSTNNGYVTNLTLTPGNVDGSVNGGFAVHLTVSNGHVTGMIDDQRWPIDFIIANGHVSGTAYGGGRVEVDFTNVMLTGNLTGSPISLQLIGQTTDAPPPDEVIAALILAAGRRPGLGR